MSELNEIILEHAEFLAGLNCVHAHAVVSIAAEHLFPEDENERNDTIKQGIASLEQRKLLYVNENGGYTLDTRLAATLTTAAFPKIAILLYHNNHKLGLQRYWFYYAEGHSVEHTFVAEKLHRLVLLPSVPFLFHRMEEILAVPTASSLHSTMEIAQDTFFALKSLAQQREHEQEQMLLDGIELNEQQTNSFLTALENPLAADNIALLRCTDDAIVDGRNIAILQNEQDTWSARNNFRVYLCLWCKQPHLPKFKSSSIAISGS